jgi:hypothetical protein
MTEPIHVKSGQHGGGAARTTRKPAKASPQRCPTPHAPDRARSTPNPETPLKSKIQRHPPLGDRDREILALCETRRRERGLSKRRTAVDAEVDAGDVVRALNLQSATPRTVLALARFFEIGDMENINRTARVEALLTEIRAHTERTAELLGKLAALAAAGDPPLL